MRNLQTRWGVGSARNAHHFDGRINKVIIILKDGLVTCVPIGHLSVHVTRGIICMFINNLERNTDVIDIQKTEITYTQNGS